MEIVKKYSKLEAIYNSIIERFPNTKYKKKLLTKLGELGQNKKINTADKHAKMLKIFTMLAIGFSPFLSDSINILTRKSNYIDTYNFTIESGREIELMLYDDHVKIKNSYDYDFSERMETLTYFSNNNFGIQNLDIKKMESEWYVHNLCYQFNIFPYNSKDADLDFSCDTRWYVNFATNVAELFYDTRINEQTNQKNDDKHSDEKQIDNNDNDKTMNK